jgi:hypothetical protein
MDGRAEREKKGNDYVLHDNMKTVCISGFPICGLPVWEATLVY